MLHLNEPQTANWKLIKVTFHLPVDAFLSWEKGNIKLYLSYIYVKYIYVSGTVLGAGKTPMKFFILMEEAENYIKMYVL